MELKMYRVKIITIGKTKESWLDEALAEYEKRLRAVLQIEWVFAKDDETLQQLVTKEPLYIALDAGGKLLDSEEFSKYLLNHLEKGGSRLAFIIGGPDGLPANLKKNTLSLSPLTFTHQIARLVLLEQIYRATEIAKGSPYHK